jgi:hypothetical protein
MTRLMNACVSGSFVVISRAASDIDTEQQIEMVRHAVPVSSES